jgi:hypothetical protein
VTVLAWFAISILVTYPLHPVLTSANREKIEIGSDTFSVDSSTAQDIELIKRVSAESTGPGESILVTPFWPGAYAIANRKSPVWEIYALWSRNDAFQQREILRLRENKTSAVVLVDLPLDGQVALRFENTHPLMYDYIRENFKAVAIAGSPPWLKVFMWSQSAWKGGE